MALVGLQILSCNQHMVYLSGFKVGEKEVAGSHSHYMDDTILFFSSEVSSVWNLKMIITCFNRACVLKILVGEVAFLALVFQIQRVNCLYLGSWVQGASLMSYLGLPLGGNLRSLPVVEPSFREM